MSIFRRFIGLILVLTALAGILISLGGIYFVWQTRDVLSQRVIAGVEPLRQSLTTTSQGLDVADRALINAQGNIDTVVGMTSTIAETISTTTPALDATAELLGTELPASITAAQNGLESAQIGARAIDDTLGFITGLNIPFVDMDEYEPDEPLEESLAGIASSLGSLPGSFEVMEDSLNAATVGLTNVEADIYSLAGGIEDINGSLDETRGVLGQYQTVITDLNSSIDGVETDLPRLFNQISWGITILLAWLAITQLGLLAQGLEMLGSSTNAIVEEKVAEALEEKEQIEAIEEDAEAKEED